MVECKNCRYYGMSTDRGPDGPISIEICNNKFVRPSGIVTAQEARQEGGTCGPVGIKYEPK